LPSWPRAPGSAVADGKKVMAAREMMENGYWIHFVEFPKHAEEVGFSSYPIAGKWRFAIIKASADNDIGRMS
jgi:hypothetical protein